MPTLPWDKWYPTNWASEPGLRLCEAATRGIWFEAINTMLLKQTYFVSGTVDQLASLCICRAPEMSVAIDQLKKYQVAEVREHNGNITLISRRRARECRIRELRRKAGYASGTKRQHRVNSATEQTGQHTSASASAYASASSLGGVQGGPPSEWTTDQARDFVTRVVLPDWQKSGADYTKAETDHALNALAANGFRWGKNPVTDLRAALERQIQTDRTNHEDHRRNYQGRSDKITRPVKGSVPNQGF